MNGSERAILCPLRSNCPTQIYELAIGHAADPNRLDPDDAELRLVLT
jgi:hypothetical protein